LAAFTIIFPINNHPYREIVPLLLTAEGDDIESFVRNAATRLLRSLDNRPGFLNLMFIELVEFNGAHISELFAAVFPQAMEIAQRMVRLGQGRLDTIPPPILIRSFLGLFFSYYMSGLILDPVASPEFSEGALDQFIDIYLHGILVD
jgi:AcrR family transcriptional regulator